MSEGHASWQQTVELPVGYPDEATGRLGKRATLRKMTGHEEAMLADPKLRGNGAKLITALLASCLTELEGVAKVTQAEARRLSAADRNFLLIELRRLTFGDEMEASYRCTRCQKTSAVVEDLSTLDVRRVEDGAAPEIPVKLKDGYKDPNGEDWHFDLVFGLPTGEDEEVAAGRRDANAATQRDVLLARCLRQVGTMESRRIQGIGPRILAALSMADRRLIQRALDQAAPGPDMTRTIRCDHCGEEFRTTLDMSQFFPLG